MGLDGPTVTIIHEPAAPVLLEARESSAARGRYDAFSMPSPTLKRA